MILNKLDKIKYLFIHLNNEEDKNNILNSIDELKVLIENYKKPVRYKCLLCGRDKFTRKSSHWCNSNYRKRNIRWEEIYE